MKIEIQMTRNKQISNYNLSKMCNVNDGGYAALVISLIVTVIVFMVGLSTSLLSVSDVQSSLAAKKSEETVDFVESCTEDALIYLNENNSLPTSVTTPEATCTITTNSQTGDDWDFTVEHTFDGYTKRVRVDAERDIGVTITSWVEVE